jgi:amino acid transporter
MPHDFPWLLALSVFSIVAFVGSLLVLPYLIVQMPADYFVRPEPKRPFALRLVRNLAALVLIAAGVAMLFLPGQGILTILAGIGFSSFPGKRDLERKLVLRGKVLPALDAIRKRAGQPPLEMPPSSS